jgi:uncharacterized protein
MSEKARVWAPEGELEELTEFQCLEYLHGATLGRIAFQSGSDVEVFPVSYAADGAIVLFRTSPGTKLAGSLRGRVAFETDGWDAKGGYGWSVVVKGVATEITEGKDPFSTALRERSLEPLAPGPREHWVAIYPAEMTGRRFRVRAEKTP